MHTILKDDFQQFEKLLEAVKKQGLSYLNGLDKRPTNGKFHGEINNYLNYKGVGTLGALEEFNIKHEKLIVGATGPRYWGYVIGGTTPAAIAGDWLATVYDQNPQALKGFGDISANLEIETIKLLLDLLELPKDFFGGFVTGATQSNFTCLAVARQWVGTTYGKNYSRTGVTEKINVLSGVPHSSAIKSLGLLGIGTDNLILVNCEEGNRESISITDLEDKIIGLHGEPFILISSAGTVNTVDFDNFSAIRTLREKYNFWWHIDAAFGAFAKCSEEHKHLLNGWEFADSITVDCHKWLNVPYESAVFFVKDNYYTLQVECFQNGNAAYLGDPLESFSYLNLGPENSRRFKALPAWFTLKAYGKEGYTDIIESNIRLAKSFGNFILENPKLELLAPVRLNTVCFAAKQDSFTNELLHKINNTGEVFMTATSYKGKNAIRAAFVNWRTNQDDVNKVENIIRNIIDNQNPILELINNELIVEY